MTKQEKLIQARTNEELIRDWVVLDGMEVTPHITMVRGWLMDEIEKRFPSEFDKWVEGSQGDNLTDYIKLMAKFEVGKTYSTRSACDHNCIFSFTILKRSAKTVTIKAEGHAVSRKVFERDNQECIFPLGKYSMAPVLRA